jgi:hypothetical protein
MRKNYSITRNLMAVVAAVIDSMEQLGEIPVWSAASIRAGICSYTYDIPKPTEVLKASVARQDMQTGHLRFCNAGHNPPIIGGGDSQGDFLEMQPNAPIGLFPGIEYEGEEIAA